MEVMYLQFTVTYIRKGSVWTRKWYAFSNSNSLLHSVIHPTYICIYLIFSESQAQVNMEILNIRSRYLLQLARYLLIIIVETLFVNENRSMLTMHKMKSPYRQNNIMFQVDAVFHLLQVLI